MDNLRYRVIILGAGFSKPAGLPLAYELWNIILKRAKSLWGRASKFNDDLKAYIAFRRDCDGVQLAPENIDFEEFLDFLDIEHYLGLRGSDTWSDDGNVGQIVVKTLIGEILSTYMPPPDSIPELYLEFAQRLQPRDYILTFNYDVLLERALDAVDKPYRLFPCRYSSISRFSGTVDNNNEEVTILKLHGSIDWFDKNAFLDRIKSQEKHGLSTLPQHPVFNCVEDWGITQIVDGPRHTDDPLLTMYRISRIEELYKQNLMFMATPWILTPSTNKILYASTLEEFWRGLGRSGGSNLGMSIIGYSLPDHDRYALQALYCLSRNYQNYYWDAEILGMKKHPLVLVDYKSTKGNIDEFLNNYRFLDKQKTELHMDGFDMNAIDKIFK